MVTPSTGQKTGKLLNISEIDDIFSISEKYDEIYCIHALDTHDVNIILTYLSIMCNALEKDGRIYMATYIAKTAWELQRAVQFGVAKNLKICDNSVKLNEKTGELTWTYERM